MSSQPDLTDILLTIPWFARLTPAQNEKLASISHLRDVKAGEEIFREGETEDFLYVVLEGRVALEIYVPHRGRVRIFTADPLEVVGWSSVTPGVRQRTASARAVGPTRLLAITAAALRELCDADHDLGYVILRRIASVVAGRLQAARLQLLDMFASPGSEVTRG